jgi:small-conductance mechanosensitive channel
MDINELIEKIGQVLEFTIFEINQTPITILSIFMFLLVLSAFLITSKVLKRFILKPIFQRMEMEPGMRYTMTRTIHYIVMVIGAVVSFQFIGIDLSGLAVIFGLLSVGIGFGLQNVTSNFISGLILLFERPIQVGDRITVGDTEGDVQAINMRATLLKSVNNISVIVPNSEFVSSRVINWSHGDPRIRVDIEVGVSYNSVLEDVLTALESVAEEHSQVLKNPKYDVLFKSFGDSSWNLLLRVWINDPQLHPIIRSDINKSIVKKFREMNIEIPFPQRDLHIKSQAEPPKNNI